MQCIKTVALLIMSMLFAITSCRQAESAQGKPLNLLKYGIPVELSAPADVDISKVGKGNLAHVSVKNSAGYDIQIFMTQAVSQDLTWLKQQKKDMVTAHPNFTKIVEEYNDGFVYEKTETDGNLSFDFIRIKLQGDQEITYMGGNSKVFTEKEVKAMLQSIL